MLKNGDTVSLSALARKAGMAKSNIYRYFESREAVLLTILAAEWNEWAQEVLAGLEQTSQGHHALAELLANTCAQRPILCQLTSILPSTLEHNVSMESIVQFKTTTMEIIDRVTHGIHQKRPELPLAHYTELFRHAIPAIIGLWPLSNPAPEIQKLLTADSMERFRYNFERELTRTLTLILSGMEPID